MLQKLTSEFVFPGLLNASRPALTDLKILIERFANSTSMDDLFDSINQIYRDADNDPELKNWFKSVDTYIRKCLKEQGFVLKDEANEQWNQLYDQGNFLLRERYKNHTNRVIDETKFLADQFDKDPQNRAFAESMNKLFSDLGTDDNGKATFKPHLLKDLRDVIIPEIINSIRYIPIPDIEFTSTDADVVIRDLVVEADNIIPNLIDVKSDNHFQYGRKNFTSTNKNKFEIHMSGIQTHLTSKSSMKLNPSKLFTLTMPRHSLLREVEEGSGNEKLGSDGRHPCRHRS